MADEIIDLPEIPDGLKEAALRGVLVPFVGAGASMIAGCPSWSDFADQALRHCIEFGRLSFGQLDQIKSLNPRVKLSLALKLQKELLAEKKPPIDFKKMLSKKNDRNGRRLYGSLSRLSKIFVTTNYDDWLDSEIAHPTLLEPGAGATSMPPIDPPRRVYASIKDIDVDCLRNPGAVIHLHGSIAIPSEMVVTTTDYAIHYANDRLNRSGSIENRVLTFLEHLFSSRTVLFVGYGLEELEVLEYIIVKSGMKPDRNPITEERHYLLKGFYSHERELMKTLSVHFKEFGVRLIPFLRDNNNWFQLVEVLENFSNVMPARGPLESEKLIEMEGLING